MKIGIVSGGFDPLHTGHVYMIQEAARHSDWLVVGVNSDAWLRRKKGRLFMNYEDRMGILRELRSVDDVRTFDDKDGTANNLLQQVRYDFPRAQITFFNGGDRGEGNVPELYTATALNIRLVYGCGGGKVRSSSDMLREWEEAGVRSE